MPLVDLVRYGAAELEAAINEMRQAGYPHSCVNWLITFQSSGALGSGQNSTTEDRTVFSDYEIHENSKTWTANLMAEADHIRQARAASPECPEPTYKPRPSVWAFFATHIRPTHA